MFKRLICRLFGHSVHVTHARRGKVKIRVAGCTRCDRTLASDVALLPTMTVPRKR